MCILCQATGQNFHAFDADNPPSAETELPPPSLTLDDSFADRSNIDQKPENLFDKSTDYEAFMTRLTSLRSGRSITNASAARTIRIDLEELNDHPDYKEAARQALLQWSAV